MYSPITEIEVTARNATSTPFFAGKYAGIVMMPANTTTNSTAQLGVWLALRRRHRLWPGTAPSRLNANVIRLALVTQAIPQNSCPTTEIRTTALAAALVSAVVKIGSAVVEAVIADGWIAANVIASSTM